ncbi:MAG: hypothetical protein ABSD80_11865 [Caulobacteraceae bacterium]|jgi:hypothetical protein
MSSCAPAPCLDPAAARAERRLALLEEMAEIGMRLLRALPAAEDESNQPAEAFARISRAVRLTLALEEKTDRFLAELKAGLVRETEEPACDEVVTSDRDRLLAAKGKRKARAFDLLLAVSESEGENLNDFEDLFDAMVERLDVYDAATGFDDPPLEAAIERLCRAMGLTPELSAMVGEGHSCGYLAAQPAFNPFSRVRSIPWDPNSPPPAPA